MSGFSGALQLSDLDDFITPSQECTKPLDLGKKSNLTGSKIKIQEDGCFQTEEDGSLQKLEKVEITLEDCLACSGCITSAESILVMQQSQEEMLRVFEENKKLKLEHSKDAKFIAVSLSIQPIISLAIRYNLPPNDCAAKLAQYFRNLGADMVTDMSVADYFALIESQKEFVKRFKEAENNEKCLPMLASNCPGWICYAEKSHGSYILPYIATTKSPQQIMGALLKKWARVNSSYKNIYHVTVMPCFDKKLEASRKEFYNKDFESRDIDCVITAIEIEQMLSKQGVSLHSLNDGKFSQHWLLSDNHEIKPNLYRHIGSGSGGFADNVFIYAAKVLFDVHITNVQYKTLRNPDFKEACLERHNKVLLRFAIANGFKNIQNLVQKLKRGKSVYHYVEVMACPSGCLNGGAQVRPQNGTTKELVVQLEKMYNSLPCKSLNDIENEKFYDFWFGGEHTDKCKATLHTSYSAVEKNIQPLNIKW